MRHERHFLMQLCWCVSISLASNLPGSELPTGVVDTQNPKDVSLTPQESLRRIEVPVGFHATLFAGEPDIRRPIAFDFDDRGRLWVVENYSHPKWKAGDGPDRIVILDDRDGDGIFDDRKVFWDKGRFLTAIAVGHGGVWIGNTPELAFIPDRDFDDVPDSDPIVKLDGFAISQNNILNNFHWGPDGWLYGAIGLRIPSVVGAPGSDASQRTKITRGMWRFHPIRGTFQVLARGMVNPWGADFNEWGDLFTSNTVIAHLWHIVPGMYCQRRDAERDNPFVYGRVQSIANHLHWGGGGWQASRSNQHRHSVAGGGHAHCGGMVYLGDNWPDEYRGTFFTGNLHGNRINNDQLLPRKSSYVGVHRPDFLVANDLWFRSMSQKYGPDGGVFISDWHDLGECHDKDGSHRSSGRIYKVVYGNPEHRSFDLQDSSSMQLVELHRHRNEWFVRHARRILQERAQAGHNLTAARETLREMLADSSDAIQRLRALWTLHVTNSLASTDLIGLLSDSSPHLRKWSVRLLAEAGDFNDVVLKALWTSADDESAVVRLAVACALQKIRPGDRWEIAMCLLDRSEDANDPYLPQMIWYAIEPLVHRDLNRALTMAQHSRIPLVRRFIVRRALDQTNPPVDEVVSFALDSSDFAASAELAEGMLEALAGRGQMPAPHNWARLRALAEQQGDARGAWVRLSTIFGDKLAIRALREKLIHSQSSTAERRSALQALLDLEDGIDQELLHKLVVEQPDLQSDALRGLLLRADRSTGTALLGDFHHIAEDNRATAISVLTSRIDAAAQLLDGLESGLVSTKYVSAYALQQLKSLPAEGIQQRVAAIWKEDAQLLAKSDEIAKYKRLLTQEFLSGGDIRAGRAIFESTCAKCHQLFGEGGDVGPDLTGSGRSNIDYVLSNLIDPSGTIDAAYRLTTVITTDGRLLTGFLAKQGERDMVLRTEENPVRILMRDVELVETSDKSMMPEGLLRSFSDEQIRDLVLYLASPDQVPLPLDE